MKTRATRLKEKLKAAKPKSKFNPKSKWGKYA